MKKEGNSPLTRIAIFYDGNYLLHVSNYYAYQHQRQSRISIRGLHDFVRQYVADEVAGHGNRQLCPIVDAHYFRGRLSAFEAKESNKLFAERQFDDILMNEGVMTHYLPVRMRRGRREEKGIDVFMALEAYERSLLKQYDVLVLIASDGDYVPLVQKLNTLGVATMLLSWDLEYTDEMGNPRETRTAQDLLEEVSYPVHMHEIIENRLGKTNPMVNNLFLATNEHRQRREYVAAPASSHAADEENGEVLTSEIFDVLNGYGFIVYPPNNLFFHFSDLIDTDFQDLRKGDKVEFTLGHNDRGPCARNVRMVAEGDRDEDDGYDYDDEEDPAYESQRETSY